MILKKISAENFGPFRGVVEITLEDGVTVFTGANDVGKSYGLKAIEMFCNRTAISEDQINLDRRSDFSGNSWQEDREIKIHATFQSGDGTEQSGYIAGRAFPSGAEVDAHLVMTRTDSGFNLTEWRQGKSRTAGGIQLNRAPKIISIPANALIREQLPVASLTDVELGFLRIGFGAGFNPNEWPSGTELVRDRRTSLAENQLNKRLLEIFPKSHPFKFRLRDIAGRGETIALYMEDQHGSYSPVGMRGTGVRRLLTFMAVLLQQVDTSDYSIVLLDEPETSLHADAQHQLRRALEALGSNPKVQVVYTTHSPSMINPSHPERIRIFTRGSDGGKAFTRVEKSTFGENWQRVRYSLGLTPSDSLLFGSVTIIVEGDTEVRCLEQLLLKLEQADVPGFEKSGELLGECILLSGEGNNAVNHCRITRAQNGNPIVFLDGDKPEIVKKINEFDPHIPVVSLPTLKEFEDLVPPERYLEAARHLLEQGGCTNLDAFGMPELKEWIAQVPHRSKMMFSKQVEGWVLGQLAARWNKHAVMEIAIERSDAHEIKAEWIGPLLNQIRLILR